MAQRRKGVGRPRRWVWRGARLTDPARPRSVRRWPWHGRRAGNLTEGVRTRAPGGPSAGWAPGIGPRGGAVPRGRLLAVGLVVTLLFGVLLGRLAQLQVLGDESRAAAQRVDTREIVLPALRGRILDRSGKPLADNRAELVVTLERRVVADSPDRARELLTKVAAVIGRPVEQLLDRTWLCGEAGAPSAPACWNGSPQVPIPIATGVDPRRALTLTERSADFPGIAVSSTPIRSYPAPDGANAAHVLGYLGQVSAAEVAASGGGLTPDDLIGRAGLEQQYDSQLRGIPGKLTVAVDARGLVTRVVSRVDAVPGKDLVTSLDAPLQVATERALRARLQAARKAGERADSGSAVVLDTRTGAVLAAASLPAFDPNVFTGGISRADYAALTAPAANHPLLARFAGTPLAPASTIKALSVVAAVRAGNALTGTYDCPSSYRIGNRDFHNYESTAHGRISLRDALRVSCDTVFYAFAHRSWLAQGGLAATSDARDPFIGVDRAFGLGETTGIDLPGEAGGRIPGREAKRADWEASRAQLCARAKGGYPEVARTDPARARYLTALAKENCATGFQFRAGDAANMSIGQGDLAATPLQMAVAYAAIANGGTHLTPRIGARLVDPETGSQTPLAAAPRRPVGLDPRVGAYVREGLRSVVTGGTAQAAFAGMPPDWPVAGKTGTAEVFGRGDTSWFVSYAPANAPRYVVTVALTQAGTGADAAAPASRMIHDALRRLR